MAEKESIQTMLQAAFTKNGDGDFSLKTSASGGGGSTTVKLDPTQNTIKLDQTAPNNTVVVTPNPLPTTLATSGNTVKIDQTGNNNTVKLPTNTAVIVTPAANTSLAGFGKATSPTAGTVIATLTLTPAGTYDVEMQSIAVGSVANLDADNFMAQIKGADFAPIQNPIYDTRATSSQGLLKFRVAAANNDVVRIIAKADATSGAIYSATIVATRNEV